MSKGEATKAAILRQAVTVASVNGLEGLSIGRLAELTGLSKSGLFGHFGSKEALQRAVLEAVVEDFRVKVILPALGEASGIDRLERLFTGWIEWAAADDKTGGCPLLAAAFELDDQPGDLRDYLAEQERAWFDCIARIAAKAVAQNQLRGDLDTAQFAFEFHAIGLGFNFAYRLLDDRKAADRAATAFRRLVASAAA
ncbi:MAG: TetR family transcriptional regulator [Gammaproteobacteria bacterium]|nr:TetR family transcriptional regulator [Gammaproteobacteria bacterium]